MGDLEELVDFFKGPITSCEYLEDDKILIGCGPYLTLVNDTSFEEISKVLALKYRVIHKIVINLQDPKQICVLGQKGFNLLSVDQEHRLFSLLENFVELEDWIFDVCWIYDASKTYLAFACAHNQCILYDLSEKNAWKISDCDQKCMLYSAKIILLNQQNGFKISPLENLLIVSGTIYNQILLWSPMDGSIQVTLDGHQGVIFNIEYFKESNFLFTASDDRSINVWSLELEEEDELRFKSGSLYARFYGHDARVWKCVAFKEPTSGLEYLCSVGEDLNVCLWNIREKSMLHRFNAMRKGWADGGLRKFEIESYLRAVDTETTKSTPTASASTAVASNEEQQQHSIGDGDYAEWSLNADAQKDFIRNLVVIEGRLICCTNLGNLNLIDTDHLGNEKDNPRLLFKSILLSNYTVMVKIKIGNKWVLAIGTLKGFVYLLNLNFANQSGLQKDEITLNCINLLSIEEELAEADDISTSSVISPASISTIVRTAGATKIFNLIWFNYKGRYFLLACFSLINGLMHLYELDNTNQLQLLARLFLPNCKQRWLTCYSIIVIQKLDENKEPTMNESLDESVGQLIYLIGGDKCGNVHLFKIEKLKSSSSQNVDEKSEDSEEAPFSCHEHLSLIKPMQSIQSVTKNNASISAIYSRRVNSNKYAVICCSQDGFYRLFEFNLDYLDDEDDDDEDDIEMKEQEEKEDNEKQAVKASAATKQAVTVAKTMLKFVNKYQINSYIDLIESFIFENDEPDGCFEMERSLKLALCFYGDKFLLWSFKLNRCLFEFKCGGANRSWDYEFQPREDDKQLFRFFYIKNKNIGEARKLVPLSELQPPTIDNHFAQSFHGNTIKTCKFLNKSGKYLLTGSEDTLIILSRIDHSRLAHLFHLQGHDSVVRCLDYCQTNANELVLVSAGGKANIKLWRIVFDATRRDSVEKVLHLYEFKRFRARKSIASQKPWMYIDLKSNPDMRFMAVRIFKSSSSNSSQSTQLFTLCFACSDGYVRIFRYRMDENKLDLILKYAYPKCLLCIEVIRLDDDDDKVFLVGFGSDGSFLNWTLKSCCDGDENQKEEEKEPSMAKVVVENLHQSGVNCFDFWRVSLVDKHSFVMASVGDDSQISILEFDIDKNEGIILTSQPFKMDKAHASSITGAKFLSRDLIATVSKDQRLIIWKIDYCQKTLKSIKVIFVNVADVSSMDVVKLESTNIYRFLIVGVGLEIIHYKIDSSV